MATGRLAQNLRYVCLSLKNMIFFLTVHPYIYSQSGTPEYTNVAYGSPHGTIAHVLATSFGLTKEQVTVSKGTGEAGEESLVAFTLSKT